MNKKEFLRQLEEELADVSLEERMAALQYFTMYFDDAGPDREQQVIEELGAPEKVAADVRAGSEDGAEGWAPPVKQDSMAKTETGSDGTSGAESVKLQLEEYPLIPHFPDPPTAPPPPSFADALPADDTGTAACAAPAQGYAGSYPAAVPATVQAQAAPPPQQGGANPVKVLLLVLLAIVLFPLAGGIAGVLAGITVVLVVPIIVGIVLGASGIAAIVGGSILIPVSAGNGILMIGSGILLLGAGLLCAYFGIWILAKGVPALWRGFSSLIKKIVQ